jgi:UDP-N-acetylmuramate--alanine ligase
MDPTCVVGGRVQRAEAAGCPVKERRAEGGGRQAEVGLEARLGQSEYLVAEADESDRSFLALYPTVAVVTNIEREHLDVYHDLADIKREFVRFVNRVPFYGSVILGVDSPAVRQIRSRAARRVVTYATAGPADFQVRDTQLYAFSSAFTVLYQSRELGRFTIPIPGMHNVANGLAAIAVAAELGIGFDVCEQALRVFAGVHRRLERRGAKRGIDIFDDYGHHPTEIRVTLAALRHAFPNRRIVVAFQPHRYSRTRLLAGEFGTAFADADELLLARVYAASEPEIPGVDATLIQAAVQAVGARPAVRYVPELPDLATALVALLRSGDVLLTLGAGNIWTIGDEVLARL